MKRWGPHQTRAQRPGKANPPQTAQLRRAVKRIRLWEAKGQAGSAAMVADKAVVEVESVVEDAAADREGVEKGSFTCRRSWTPACAGVTIHDLM